MQKLILVYETKKKKEEEHWSNLQLTLLCPITVLDTVHLEAQFFPTRKVEGR